MKQLFIVLMSLIFICSFVASCEQNTISTKSFIHQNKENTSLENLFTQVEYYMDIRVYDSAQMILNNIGEKLLFKSTNIYHYLQSSRQAEIYYYNHLHHLGLLEAQKAEKIAHQLNRTILLLDAYNYQGLFYANLDSIDKSIQNFNKGKSIIGEDLSIYDNHFNLSLPFHLYGNLAEAYFKNNQSDSSIFYAHISLKLATKANVLRAILLAEVQLGDAFQQLGQIDSAVHYYHLALQSNTLEIYDDVRLLCLGNLAVLKFNQREKEKSDTLLSEGFKILNNTDRINPYFQKYFLNASKEIFESLQDYRQLYLIENKIIELNDRVHNAANLRYLEVALVGLKKESKILNLEVEKAQKDKKLANTRLTIVLLIFLVIIIIFLLYRFKSKQVLEISQLRNNISQDLHDEVGATLSGIALYSHIIRNQLQQEHTQKVFDSINVIEKNATDMVKKLSDIIWAVNPKYDNLDNLLSRLYEFAVEISRPKSIQVILNSSISSSTKLTLEYRKNLYLLCKEAINNAVKYSEAKTIEIEVTKEHQYLILKISDDGIGFPIVKEHKGNGMDNMKARAEEMNAEFEIDSSQKGTMISVKLKFT